MAPKEHGAYGQLGFPLLVAMLLGKPTVVAALLLVASIVLFLAHEPLVLLLGQRGSKALREDAKRAKRKLITLSSISILFGAVAFWLADFTVRYAVLLAAACVALAIRFMWKRQERSLIGELWLALTLPLASVPVALANGVAPATCVYVAVSFVLAYASGVFGVRGIILDFKQGAKTAGYFGLGIIATVTVALSHFSRPASLACALFLMVVTVIRLARPKPISLKKVGWLLVLASIGQAFALVNSFR